MSPRYTPQPFGLRSYISSIMPCTSSTQSASSSLYSSLLPLTHTPHPNSFSPKRHSFLVPRSLFPSLFTLSCSRLTHESCPPLPTGRRRRPPRPSFTTPLTNHHTFRTQPLSQTVIHGGPSITPRVNNSTLPPRASNLESRVSSFEPPTSRLEPRASNLPPPASSLEPRGARGARGQSPDSSTRDRRTHREWARGRELADRGLEHSLPTPKFRGREHARPPGSGTPKPPKPPNHPSLPKL